MEGAVSDPGEYQQQTRTVISTDGGSLTVSFLVTVQQTLMEEFTGGVLGAALASAHRAGYIPMGSPVVSVTPAQPEPLAEGVQMYSTLEDIAIDNAILSGDLAQVRVEYIEWMSAL